MKNKKIKYSPRKTRQESTKKQRSSKCRRIGTQSKRNKYDNTKIKYFEGRWTTEEENKFETNYKKFISKKITKQELKSSIPTRSYEQVTSHLTKMKNHYDAKFSIVSNPSLREKIPELIKFFSNEQTKNSYYKDNEKNPLNAKVILYDQTTQGRHFAISVENLLLIRSLTKGEKTVKFDANLLANLLLMKKNIYENKKFLEKYDTLHGR